MAPADWPWPYARICGDQGHQRLWRSTAVVERRAPGSLIPQDYEISAVAGFPADDTWPCSAAARVVLSDEPAKNQSTGCHWPSASLLLPRPLLPASSIDTTFRLDRLRPGRVSVESAAFTRRASRSIPAQLRV